MHFQQCTGRLIWSKNINHPIRFFHFSPSMSSESSCKLNQNLTFMFSSEKIWDNKFIFRLQSVFVMMQSHYKCWGWHQIDLIRKLPNNEIITEYAQNEINFLLALLLLLHDGHFIQWVNALIWKPCNQRQLTSSKDLLIHHMSTVCYWNPPFFQKPPNNNGNMARAQK